MLKDYHLIGENGQACSLNDATPDSWQAQTFTPFDSYTPTSLQLKCYRQSESVTGTITVNIYATSSDLPVGPVLATGTLDASLLGTSSPGDWQTITLSGTPLTAGTRYAFSKSGVLSGGNVYFRTSGSTNYPFGGRDYTTDAGATWLPYAGDTTDVVFKISDSIDYDSQMLFAAGNVDGGNHLWKLTDDGIDLTLISSHDAGGTVLDLACSPTDRKLFVAVGSTVTCYDIDTMDIDTDWGVSGVVDLGVTVRGVAVDSSGFLAVGHDTSANSLMTLFDATGTLSVAGAAVSGIAVGGHVAFTKDGDILEVSQYGNNSTTISFRMDRTTGAVTVIDTRGVSLLGRPGWDIVGDPNDDTKSWYCNIDTGAIHHFIGVSEEWESSLDEPYSVVYYPDIGLLNVIEGVHVKVFDADAGGTHPWADHSSGSGSSLSIGDLYSSDKNEYGNLYVCSKTGYVGICRPYGDLKTSLKISADDLHAVVSAGDVYTAPTSVSQTASQYVAVTDEVVLSAVFTGTPTPTYQWYKDDVEISGETASTYIFTADVNSDGVYKCRATNLMGLADSGDITISLKPYMADQSNDISIAINSSVTLTVTAVGTPTLTYEWYKNGSLIAGETSSTLTKYWNNSDAGTYKCTVTNVGGATDSDDIAVTIVDNPYIFNLFDIPFDISREETSE